jgi:hypothetical protein
MLVTGIQEKHQTISGQLETCVPLCFEYFNAYVLLASAVDGVHLVFSGECQQTEKIVIWK